MEDSGHRNKAIASLNGNDDAALLKEIARNEHELPELCILALSLLGPAEADFLKETAGDNNINEKVVLPR